MTQNCFTSKLTIIDNLNTIFVLERIFQMRKIV